MFKSTITKNGILAFGIFTFEKKIAFWHLAFLNLRTKMLLAFWHFGIWHFGIFGFTKRNAKNGILAFWHFHFSRHMPTYARYPPRPHMQMPNFMPRAHMMPQRPHRHQQAKELCNRSTPV